VLALPWNTTHFVSAIRDNCLVSDISIVEGVERTTGTGASSEWIVMFGLLLRCYFISVLLMGGVY